MNARLKEAIRFRTIGEKEASRQLLLALVAEHPTNADVLYQCAWTHDGLGREREAVGFYERAISAGLSGPDLAGAYLGLGSTLRGLGQYEMATEVLEKGVGSFPENRPLQVFLAMALYNVGRSKESVSGLLRLLVDTSSDSAITDFSRAIRLYAEDLDRIWKN